MTFRFFATIVTPLLPLLIAGCGLARAPLVAVESDAGAVDLAQKIVLNRNSLKASTPPPIYYSSGAGLHAVSFALEIGKPLMGSDANYPENLVRGDFQRLCEKKGGRLEGTGPFTVDVRYAYCKRGADEFVFGYYLYSRPIYSYGKQSPPGCAKDFNYAVVTGIAIDPDFPMKVVDFINRMNDSAMLESLKMSGGWGCGVISSGIEINKLSLMDAEKKRAIAAEQRREAERISREKQRKEALAAQEAFQQQLSRQPAVRTVGAEVCIQFEGENRVQGEVTFGKKGDFFPVQRYSKENVIYTISGTTERVAGNRIQVRIEKLFFTAKDNRVASYNSIRHGDRIYSVGQLSWDESINWDVCR